MKAKLLGAPIRSRRTGLAIRDQQVLAQLVAMLGSTRAFQNLSEIAELAQAGALPLAPEIEAELLAALSDLRAMRRLLLEALGLKAGDEPSFPVPASAASLAVEDA